MPLTFVPTITIYPSYIRNYSKRHQIPPKIVQDREALNLAATLEYKVGLNKLTITQARYQFLSRYKNTNVIPTSASVVKVAGYRFLWSVIDLVRPYPECDYGIPTMRTYKGVYETQICTNKMAGKLCCGSA